MEKVTIRAVHVEDAAPLLAYTQQVGKETDNLTFGSEGLPYTVEEQRQILERITHSTNAAFYVAVKNNTIVGAANISALGRRRSHWGTIGLSVLQSEWGQGIGRSLMSALMNFAMKSGIEMIELEVRSDNHRAIHLYQQFGFERIGTLPNRMQVAKEYYHCDIMYATVRQNSHRENAK